jgi:hypothetical protein
VRNEIRGALVLVAIGGLFFLSWNSAENGEDLMDVYDAVKVERLADKEAAATILAKDRAGAAFADETASCRAASKADCEPAARAAALSAARKALLEGGCIDWEMSEWDPSRGLAPRAAPKSRPDAEAACEAQASAIANRFPQ